MNRLLCVCVSSRRRHTRCALVTGVQTCALPIACSGGGGRVDLGILDRNDRVWASDCNDPVERVQIERWTRTLVPPELIGSHVGPAREIGRASCRATVCQYV